MIDKMLDGKLFSQPFNKNRTILPNFSNSRKDITGKTTNTKIVIPKYTPIKDTRERL